MSVPPRSFLGGHCPTPTAVIDAVYRGSKGNLIVEDLENIGGHYAKALRIWREEFVAKFDDVVSKADDKHKKIYDDVFKRKWEFCECLLGLLVIWEKKNEN